MLRMMVYLTTEENAAIHKLAEQECREPRDQIRHMLRKELERLKLLPVAGSAQGET